MKKNIVYIEDFINYKEQDSILGNCVWSVTSLIELSRNLECFEIPLIHLNICYEFGSMNLRKMVEHVKCINNADLKYPIILDQDGDIMDGRHRVMKALILGKKTIKAVRFTKNPIPDKRIGN